MTEMRFRLALEIFQGREPFLPFVIELTSGSLVRISASNQIQVREGLIYCFSPDAPPREFVFDHDSVAMIFDPRPDTNAPDDDDVNG